MECTLCPPFTPPFGYICHSLFWTFRNYLSRKLTFGLSQYSFSEFQGLQVECHVYKVSKPECVFNIPICTYICCLMGLSWDTTDYLESQRRIMSLEINSFIPKLVKTFYHLPPFFLWRHNTYRVILAWGC